MQRIIFLRPARGTPAPGLVLLGTVAVAGCQSYAPKPLDLHAHRQALAERARDTDALDAYADRARTNGETTDVFSLSDGLTLAEAEVLALFHNQDLRIARLEAGIAAATLEHAGRWEDPVLGFEADDVLTGSVPLEYAITLGLTLPISGRLAAERDRADAAHRLELQRVLDLEWTTRHAVRSAWAAWSEADARLRLLGTQIEQIEHISGIAERLEQAEELTRSESRLLRIELAQRCASLVQSQADEQNTRIELLTLLGLAPDADLSLIPSLPVPAPELPEDPAERLIAFNTGLAVERAAYQEAEESLRLAVRKQYPDLSIGPGYGRDEGEDRLLLGFSVAIPVFNANRREIAEARARRAAARASAEAMLEQLLGAYRAARVRLESAKAQQAIYEEQVIPMLERQSDEISQLMDLGEVDTLRLLETVKRGYEARSELLTLRLASLRAAIDLSRLLGPDELINASARDIDPGPATSDLTGDDQ